MSDRILNTVLLENENIHKKYFNPLIANPTKRSSTLKQFVSKLPTNCLSVFDHFVGMTLKELIDLSKAFDSVDIRLDFINIGLNFVYLLTKPWNRVKFNAALSS